MRLFLIAPIAFFAVFIGLGLADALGRVPVIGMFAILPVPFVSAVGLTTVGAAFQAFANRLVGLIAGLWAFAGYAAGWLGSNLFYYVMYGLHHCGDKPVNAYWCGQPLAYTKTTIEYLYLERYSNPSAHNHWIEQNDQWLDQMINTIPTLAMRWTHTVVAAPHLALAANLAIGLCFFVVLGIAGAIVVEKLMTTPDVAECEIRRLSGRSDCRPRYGAMPSASWRRSTH